MPGRNLIDWKALPTVVEQTAARNGRTLTQVAPAITEKNSRYWVVDTTHEAWTGVKADTLSGPWAPLHALADNPPANPYTLLAGVYGWAANLPEPRAAQAASRLTRVPLNVADPKHWAETFHSDTSRMLGKSVRRGPHRFAYFTGSNRTGEGARMAAMIRSARRAGVAEDFHAFAVERVQGAVNHPIPASRPWKNHMAKIDLLAELAVSTGDRYDAYVWLDSDNWFVRDPGDMRTLLRDNPIWVGMESDLRQSIQGDWYGMPIRGTPSVFDTLAAAGCRSDFTYGVNGGMWVVRREAVAEFHQRAFAACKVFADRGYPNATNDEPTLSVLGSTMVRDPELNTIAKWSHVWACDWVGRWTERLPDGRPWAYKDWGTQQDVGDISPAIVHNMRGKHLMR